MQTQQPPCVSQSTGWGGAGGRPPSPPRSPLRIPRPVPISLNGANLSPVPHPRRIPDPRWSPVGTAKQGEKYLIMVISVKI